VWSGIGVEWEFAVNADRIFAVGYEGNDHIELEDVLTPASIYGGAGTLVCAR
jgi:hypothetical protein